MESNTALKETITLDDQQKAAVYAESKKVLCLSGAGSGKTRVIVERIAYLVEQKKVSSYEILALTFTRRAAGELRSRIEERIGNKAKAITIGTIHAVGLKLLHRFGELIGMRPSKITVYGGWEEEYLIRGIADDLSLLKGKNKTWKIPKKIIYAMLNNYYSKGKEPDEDHPGYSLFRELLTRCRENNAVTYGMILTSLMVLVPKIKQYLKWKHIFLDEAQDTDPLQWWIVEEFPKLLGASLFAVGDIDQSVYKFRGAYPEYLIKTQHTFDIYRIENNYRSVPEIVIASNNLIEKNQQRLPKTMRAVRKGFGVPGVEIETNFDSNVIADYIKRTLDQGVKPNEMAVLSRIHILLNKLSKELELLNVPHEKIGRKLELTNSEAFRRYHAFLKLLVNPYDNFAFLLIRELLGISRDSYNEFRLKASQEGKSHFQAWLETAPEEYQYFFNGFLSMSLASQAFSIKYMATGAMPYGGDGWGFDIEGVSEFVFSWLVENPNGSIQEYLSWLATYDLQDEIQEAVEKVQLMTIHCSKGMEFSTVILIGANEGILPSKQAIQADDIEEERRIMYVALTRAKDMALLAVRPERKERANGHIDENPQSRFIGELAN